jgi:tRNA pseudouridine55 synthase
VIGESIKSGTISGVLVVDKPSGPTSHDVVARVRARTGVKRVGHTGTLDPLASGVLPLVLGRATRLARYLSSGDKTYEAVIRLGAATETYDSASAPEELPVPASVTTEEISAALNGFRGTFRQTPPPYSAKKIGGVRAYKLARAARPTMPEPVDVTVRELSLDSYLDGEVRIRVACSAGFYVRSLAHDLGTALGCGGHLAVLKRTASGPFTLSDAVPLALVENDPRRALEGVIGIDGLLTHLPAAVLTDAGAQRVAHGNPVAGGDIVRGLPAGAGREAGAPGSGACPVRLLDGRGTLLGIAEPRPGALHPVVVLV